MTGDAQSPAPGRLNLDHVAHFVPSREACEVALAQLGFRPTPFSLQRHRPHPGAPLVPAGTGNHCVMLRQGYLEFLVPLADTEVARQLRSGIDRYVGTHSIVFGTGDAAREHERLRACGFRPLPPIALERPAETLHGEALARFTVVRVPPGTMAEGRIQFCQHHTEPLLWQERWLSHPNGASRLAGVWVGVEDPAAAGERYARFSAIAVAPRPDGSLELQTERGWIRFCDRTVLERTLGIAAAALPMIAACELRTDDLAACRRLLQRSGLTVGTLPTGAIAVRAPAAIGGTFVFAAA